MAPVVWVAILYPLLLSLEWFGMKGLGEFYMKEEHDDIDVKSISRRELVRSGAKAAYVVPAVLAAIKATERPAFAQFSCAPNEISIPEEMGASCQVCPPDSPVPSPDGFFCVPGILPNMM